jgi:hypothetical protein
MTEAEQISAENSKKLDEVLMMLKGQGDDSPGLIAKVHAHSVELYGSQGRLGLTQKMAVVWRSGIWVLCSLSGIGGYLLRTLIH